MVDLLDMRGILGVYAGKGKKPYHPAMLVALLFYIRNVTRKTTKLFETQSHNECPQQPCEILLAA
jgi:hypothetical protein